MTKSKAPKKRHNAGPSKASKAARAKLWIEAMLSNSGNATAAAVAAGYTPGEAAHKAGYRLSRDPAIAAELERRRTEEVGKAQVRTGLSIDRVLLEVARLSTFDIRKLFKEDGSLKHITELDDDTAAAVASVEEYREYSGRGEDREQVGTTTKVKVFDKNAALEKAMKTLGLYGKDGAPPPTPPGGVTINAQGNVIVMSPEEAYRQMLEGR